MTPEDRIKKLGSADEATPTEAEWMSFRTKAHRSVAGHRVAAGLGGVALVVIAVVGFYVVTAPEPPDGQREFRPGIATTETEPNTETRSKNGSEKQETVAVQQWFVEDEKLALFHTQVPRSQTPAKDAMETLLRGVPSPLGETGVETYIPEGTALQDLTIDNGTAEITLSGDFPDESDAQQDFAMAQIVYTLTQFPSVENVAMAWESAESGGTAVGPETRERYDDYLPPIVVEAPYPGQRVGRTFKLSGIANVHEATVSWQLTDLDGEPFKKGFITATCGTGCWGTFKDRLSLERVPGESIILEVFQSSAEDGSQLDLVKIPLNVETGGP